jgi:ABC-type polysaccharide transport system permease subunit
MQQKFFYIMILPGILFMLFFNYIPLSGLVLAFKDFNARSGIWGSPWVGFDNFKFFFAGGDMAWRATKNTLILNTFYTVFITFFSVTMAIFLNEMKSRFLQRFSQSAMFLPYFLSWAVIGAITYSFLANKGVMNQLLESFGLEPRFWFGSPHGWWTIMVVINVWKWTGYNAVVYLAALVGFDNTYYEAATIDGASKWQQIRYITLPLLKGTMIVLTLLQVGRIFFTDVTMVIGVTQLNSQVIPAVDVIDSFVYRSLTGLGLGNFSMASAISLYQSAAGFILIMLVNYIVRRVNPEYKLF